MDGAHLALIIGIELAGKLVGVGHLDLADQPHHISP